MHCIENDIWIFEGSFHAFSDCEAYLMGTIDDRFLGYYLSNIKNHVCNKKYEEYDDRLSCYFDYANKCWNLAQNSGHMPENEVQLYHHCSVRLSNKQILIFNRSDTHFHVGIKQNTPNSSKEVIWSKTNKMSHLVSSDDHFFPLCRNAVYHELSELVGLCSVGSDGQLRVCLINPKEKNTIHFCESSFVIENTPWHDILNPISNILANFDSFDETYNGWYMYYYNLLLDVIENDIFLKFQAILLDGNSYFKLDGNKRTGTDSDQCRLIRDQNIEF